MNAFGIFPSRSSPNPLMTNVLICDNFLIGDSGVAEKLHKFPQKIVELG